MTDVTPAPERPTRLRLSLESLALLALALLVTTWFAGWPSGLPTWVPSLLLGALLGIGAVTCRPCVPRPHLETWAVLALAVAYRLPALLHPWGLVNRDGAYGAYVALHLLAGQRPAPVFTEGANYQGTLKGHLAALFSLITGWHDFSFHLTAAGVVLSLIFILATMALARRLGGRGAALATGLYLALGPKFLTIFTLNNVGQYADILALGGLALALLARLLDLDLGGPPARGHYLGLGLLLGAACWQQPVALSYAAAAGLVLLLRRRTRRDPWALLGPLGFLLGALPVLLWNLQHGWASGDIMGRDADLLRAQAEALPVLIQRTLTVAFPILAGLSPGHPWSAAPLVPTLARLFLPALLLASLTLTGRHIWRGLRQARPPSAILPPLLLACSLAFFWAVASGHVYSRPRYLLPVMAASSVHLGVVSAWTWKRSRALAAVGLAALVAFGAAATVPRLRQCAAIEERYRAIVQSLEEKGIRTGYADFSLAAPVTMFTAERILLSPRLGPTPAYESEQQEQRVVREGADAFVLRPNDDSEAFAAALTRLGVSFRFQATPVPVFYQLSKRVAVEEVRGFRGEIEAAEPDE